MEINGDLGSRIPRKKLVPKITAEGSPLYNVKSVTTNNNNNNNIHNLTVKL